MKIIEQFPAVSSPALVSYIWVWDFGIFSGELDPRKALLTVRKRVYLLIYMKKHGFEKDKEA